eukprot:4362384-Pleurochrysis_carterae.AAC.1
MPNMHGTVVKTSTQSERCQSRAPCDARMLTCVFCVLNLTPPQVTPIEGVVTIANIFLSMTEVDALLRAAASDLTLPCKIAADAFEG